MECNVSQTDKNVRVVLSIGLIILGLVLITPVGVVGFIIPAAIGGILLATVRLNFCPIYAVLGLSTCKPQTES